MPAYGPDSFWNLPIAPGAPLDPNSANMVSKALVAYAGSSNFANTDAWGKPVWIAKPTDKLYSIKCSRYDCDKQVSTRIPAGAKPSTGSDHHMVVIDGDVETDMWLASYDPGTDTWTAGSRYQSSITGWGAICKNVPGNIQHCNGAVAAGFSAHGGNIRPEEIAQGHIDHALFITTPFTRAGLIACPATHTDGKYADPNALPEGARVQLDPAFNVDAQPWARWQKILAKALQRYGAFLGDTGGSVAIFGEAANLDGRAGTWASVGVPTGASLSFLPWSLFRVLQVTSC